MIYFTNTYNNIKMSTDAVDLVINKYSEKFIIGNNDNGGYVSSIDDNGKIIKSFQYNAVPRKVIFYKALIIENEEILLLGYNINDDKTTTAYIFRLTRDLKVSFAKSIKTENIVTLTSFTLLPFNECLITSFYESGNSFFYAVKINYNGEVLNAKRFSFGGKDILGGAVTQDKHIVLYGIIKKSQNAFLINLDLNLNSLGTTLIRCNDFSLIDINSAIFGLKKTLILHFKASKDNNKYSSIVLRGYFNDNKFNLLDNTVIAWEDPNLSCDTVKQNESFIYLINNDKNSAYSRVTKLDYDLNIRYQKVLEFNNYYLRGITVFNGEFYYYGKIKTTEKTEAFVLKTDTEYTSCKANPLQKTIQKPTEIFVQEEKVDTKDIKVDIKDCKTQILDFDLRETPHCKTTTFSLSDNYLIQSPFLNLQTAGSKGLDSSKGIHLRWFLINELQNHIPKGNYSNNNYFFNKKNDFVNIYRIPYDYTKRTVANINVYGTQPNVINKTERIWVYKIGNEVYYLKFIDASNYDNITLDPSSDSRAFLEQYGNGILELRLKNNLSFAINLFRDLSMGNVVIRTETFSVLNKQHVEPGIISSRKTFNSTTGEQFRIIGNNIKTIRFSLLEGGISEIEFETYGSFLNNQIQNNNILYLGSFALSTDDAAVFARLEDINKYTINDHWKKYNNDACVNVSNYKKRWLQGDFGLKRGTEEYINLSETDYEAKKIFDSQDIKDKSKIEISIQKYLNFAALDFHAARMLGFGLINSDPNVSTGEKFIYLAEYITEKDPLDQNNSTVTQHIYLSLPSSIHDERLPQNLKMNPVNYGLKIDNGTESPMLITDENGYAPYINSRFVNLYAELENNYLLTYSFYNPVIEFQCSEFSAPVFVGFENKKSAETSWRIEEIAHDRFYKDTNGVFETANVIFNNTVNKPLFIHEITEVGIDDYCAYPINIFSRAGQLSNNTSTDYTIFKKANTLKAPSNIHTQLIQIENPLILTSQNEQTWLTDINNNNTNEILVRLTFDYYHIHDENYHYGNMVQIFFRKNLPCSVVGKITKISDDVNTEYCVLETDNYIYESTTEQIVPTIPQNMIQNFIGAILSYKGKEYIVTNISLPNLEGIHPIITVKKIQKRDAIDQGNGNYQLIQSFEGPELDLNEAFLLVENMLKAESWDNNKLSFKVELGEQGWSKYTETYLDGENNEIHSTVKGIWGHCSISNLKNPPNGIYKIEFIDKVLNNHSQYNSINDPNVKASVNWYKGFIRVRTMGDTYNNKQRKVLQVISIENVGIAQNLTVIAYDDKFDASDLNNVNNIVMGNNIHVNFHPGYRVYLKTDNTADFNIDSVMPILKEGSRKTLFGLSTVDTATLDEYSLPYHSPIGVPAIIFAQEIQEPAKAYRPDGPFYATPPNYYNKSTYSFSVKFDTEPWGIMFYRVDIRRILTSLYTQETIYGIGGILSMLPPIYEDLYFQRQWENLLSFNYIENGDNGNFKEFPLADGTYRFPNPDKENIFVLTPNSETQKPGDVVDKIKKAVYSNMLPLTEQPLIYDFIKEIAPRAKKQTVRDKYGKLLNPDDKDFDQAPMAKKIGDNTILFVDFSLEGNMDKNTAYVYMVRTLSNKMVLGEPSPIHGPVQLVNTSPPDELIVRKVTSQTGEYSNNYQAAVVFEINKPSIGQGIDKIQIYRTLESVNALTVRTMGLPIEVDLRDLELTESNTYIMKDDFSDLLELPYSEPLYYKLIAVRIIKYKDFLDNEIFENVYSKPTKTLLANIIDTKNPETPTILPTYEDLTLPDKLTNVMLKWNKTCYNGSYQLYKMNNSGNWVKLTNIVTNNENQLYYDIGDLTKQEDGLAIYHRFKVTVENSSGLLNLDEKILTF